MTKQPSIVFYDNYIVFRSPEDCDGETLLADVYSNDGQKTLIGRISTGNDKGKKKGELLTLELDYTGIDNGSYFLKIWTSETGVLAKLIIRETVQI